MIKRFKELQNKYDYDSKRAEYVRDWIKENCHHVEGEWAGRPFELLEFQWEDIIKPVFGLVNKDGTRLINECYIEIPKKNGKTTLMAAIELYLLFADGEPGAKIFNCAGDDDQADLLFSTAKQMVFSEQRLERNSRQLLTKIIHKDRYIQKVTSKAGTKHGKNAHAVIMDELHVQQNADLYETMKYAGSTRRNPLFFQITTAGFDKTSICWDRHEYNRKINEGIIQDDNFWGVIYAAKETDDPFSEKTWSQVNPIYKHSTTFQKHFKKDAQEAQNNVSIESAFKRLRLNIWTGSEEKWIATEVWNKGNRPIPDLTGRVCYGGLDLSSVSDTTAFVLLFPWDDFYYVMPFIFVPEMMVDRRDKRNDTFYYKWAKEGHLIRTPGNSIDYRIVKAKIDECRQKYDLKSIGYDPWNARQLITEWIETEGLTMNEYRQGYATMSEPTKQFEKLCLDGKVIHGGHPVLSWMEDNAMLMKDNNDNQRIAKGDISKDKVDGIQAAIMALGECIRYKQEFDSIMTLAI